MAKKTSQNHKLSTINILDDHEFLTKLIVGIGEVAEITNIPQRKLRYWQEKGLIKTVDESGTTRRFNYLEIKKILLIKELLDEGFTLEAAANKVEKRIELINSTFKKFKNRHTE
ncbi:MAG: MerR family transcriptional regulator [Gammaproteobacteria bacterium]|nr:MAG: MerR family transcriptional regulator [Gammaproteobacteria bacterium]